MIDTTALQNSISLWHPLAPDFHAKKTFHKEARKFLKNLGETLGLSDYEVKVNAGGDAVSGEATLYSDRLMVSICADLAYQGLGPVLFRSTNGKKDYTGGGNNWVNVVNAEDRIACFINYMFYQNS